MEIQNNNNRKSFSFMIRVPLLILILLFFIFGVRYTSDQNFKYKVDKDILKKEVSEDNLNSIEIDSDDNSTSYAYDKYICLLNKNKLTEYNSNGEIIAELDVNVSIPLFASSDKYLVLADKESTNFYLISGSNILWKNSIEGEISQINVNKNGYVSIIVKNTIYKSIIIYYDLSGTEVFRYYISRNYATCSAISPDNNYLAVGEINYSGTIIKSLVNIISVDLAKTDPKNSVVYTYNAENGEILSMINYQSNDYALCMFTNYIQKVTPNSDSRFLELTSNDLFVDINLENKLAKINKQSSGLYSFKYEISFVNTSNMQENLYILDSDLPKSLYSSQSVIALNLGNEVHVINDSGWLLKKYSSSKQVNNIILGKHIAGIIYKNKIEIISF